MSKSTGPQDEALSAMQRQAALSAAELLHFLLNTKISMMPKNKNTLLLDFAHFPDHKHLP